MNDDEGEWAKCFHQLFYPMARYYLRRYRFLGQIGKNRLHPSVSTNRYVNISQCRKTLKWGLDGTTRPVQTRHFPCGSCKYILLIVPAVCIDLPYDLKFFLLSAQLEGDGYSNSLHTNPIGHISSSSFTGTNNFDHHPSFHSKVASHWIIRLNTGQLRLLQSIAFQ